MTPTVRNTRDALLGVAFFFAAQALVSDAPPATEENHMLTESHTVPVATTLPRSEESLSDLLALVGVEVTADEISDWSDWKQQKAEDWAGSMLMRKSAGTAPLPKPGFLSAYVTSDGGARP